MTIDELKRILMEETKGYLGTPIQEVLSEEKKEQMRKNIATCLPLGIGPVEISIEQNLLDESIISIEVQSCHYPEHPINMQEIRVRYTSSLES